MEKRYDSLDSGATLVAGDRLAASWVASARLLLTLLSVGAVLLDRTVPSSGNHEAFLWALSASSAFLVVALVARIALDRKWVHPETMLIAGPFLDLVLAGLLILSTNGYLSPFTLWIVFAVVETAFVGRTRLTFVVAGLGAMIHMLIALVPQDRPLDTAVLVVRVSYLAGFALLVGSVGGVLARRNRELAGIEGLGRRLQEAPDVPRACAYAARSFGEVLRASGVEVASGDLRHSWGAMVGIGSKTLWDAKPDVQVSLWRDRPCSHDELAVGRVMTDRLAVALRRLRLTQALVEGAAREERLRLADEVHDGYLQTLAASMIRLEVARQLSGANEDAREEIEVVKQLLRDGTNRARAFLAAQVIESPAGPEQLRSILVERWRGPWEIQIDSDVRLSEAQWSVCAMLLREGLNNALSHGRAVHATFEVTQGKGGVRVALECDGESPPEQVRFGFGLRRLSEVLGTQGAGLSLERADRGGSRLVATFGDNSG